MPAAELTAYAASVPLFKRQLHQLQLMLDKARQHGEHRGSNAELLLQTRLVYDMFPLIRQVQIACDTAKGCCARLAGVEVPRHSDSETSLAELKTRIELTLDFIDSLRPEQFADAATRQIELRFPNSTLRFVGLDYLTQFALPNFFFHVTTVYALLRHNGVALGKSDYLGPAGRD